VPNAKAILRLETEVHFLQMQVANMQRRIDNLKVVVEQIKESGNARME